VDTVGREMDYVFPESSRKGKKKNARAEKNEAKEKETKMGAKNRGKEKLKKKPKKDKQKGNKGKQPISPVPTGVAPSPGHPATEH